MYTNTLMHIKLSYDCFSFTKGFIVKYSLESTRSTSTWIDNPSVEMLLCQLWSIYLKPYGIITLNVRFGKMSIVTKLVVEFHRNISETCNIIMHESIENSWILIFNVHWPLQLSWWKISCIIDLMKWLQSLFP